MAIFGNLAPKLNAGIGRWLTQDPKFQLELKIIELAKLPDQKLIFAPG